MSIEQDEARHAGGAGELETSVCLAASDGSVNTKPNPQAQAAIADLHREFIAECLKIVAIQASHGADNVLLGDDLNAERDIHLAIFARPQRLLMRGYAMPSRELEARHCHCLH